MFHYECPWPSAQAEIAAISAYKTPRDKLQCVFRCATTIMNLLKMVQERNIPAADDLVPVLVYVLIKVSLLKVKPIAFMSMPSPLIFLSFRLIPLLSFQLFNM